MGEAMNYADLQRIVNRMRARLIVEKTHSFRNFQFRLRVEGIGAWRRTIGRAENIEIVAFRSCVGEIEQPISAECRFGAECPDLGAAVAIERIHGGGVENASGVAVLNLKQSCLQHERLGGRCQLSGRSCERRLVGEVVCGERVVGRFVVENRVACAHHCLRFDHREAAMPRRCEAPSFRNRHERAPGDIGR